MRLWIGGPRILGLRTGVGFNFDGGYRPQPSISAAGSYVYVAEGHGRVKIGITRDPDSRLATLQTGSPFPLAMTFVTWAGDHAFDVEQKAHELLEFRRLSGEWFNATREEAITAVYAAAVKLQVPLDVAPMSIRWWKRVHPLAWFLAAWVAIGAAMNLLGYRP